MRHYYGTVEGPGARPFYFDPGRVGAFATDPEAIAANDPASVHRLATCLLMFQARKDEEIMAHQRSLPPAAVAAVADPATIAGAAAAARCPFVGDHVALLRSCDAATFAPGDVECSWLFGEPCPVKAASATLRRYGDFGKVPYSLAALPGTFGLASLADLHGEALRTRTCPRDRARWLEEALCRVWRVDLKIADFVLSALSNPDLAAGACPWRPGVDWRHFVVVDRHVTRGLVELGAPAGAPYETYRRWLRTFARRIDLRKYRDDVHAENPRLIQQALYRFRSPLNRRAAAVDCCHAAPRACRRCPTSLRRGCVLRPQQRRPARKSR